MIPSAYITEWRSFAPWHTNEQVEQDLIIGRALIEIYSEPFLAEHLAFRGGTALHKLFLHPQFRYSEDIDLVQISPGPIKPIITGLQERLAFLGKSAVSQKKDNNTLRFRFESEIPPVQPLKLKVEINCREHFSVLEYTRTKFSLASSWFSEASTITTYHLEELLGTKLRALYQRRKGRDLYDLYKALSSEKVNKEELLHCFREYMAFSVGKAPTALQYIQNMEAKLLDSEFLGDTVALLRPTESYDPLIAWELVRDELVSWI